MMAATCTYGKRKTGDESILDQPRLGRWLSLLIQLYRVRSSRPTFVSNWQVGRGYQGYHVLRGCCLFTYSSRGARTEHVRNIQASCSVIWGFISEKPPRWRTCALAIAPLLRIADDCLPAHRNSAGTDPVSRPPCLHQRLHPPLPCWGSGADLPVQG